MSRESVSSIPARIAYVGFKAYSRGMTREELKRLPQLGRPFDAACAPLAALFDSQWTYEPHTRRQMVGLCIRCPLNQTCSERKT